MTEAFDTSGVVRRLNDLGDTTRTRPVAWGDLTPFEQGYVEALFAGPRNWPGKDFAAFKARGMRPLGFRDLDPSALEMIREDCARFLADPGASWLVSACVPGSWGNEGMRNAGDTFWRTRNGNEYDFTFAQRTGRGSDWPNMSAGALQAAAKRFPPLTISLNDSGLVCLSVEGAGQ